MTLTKSTFYGGAVLIILAIMYLLGASASRVGAVAPVSVSVATTSNPTVTSTAGTLFATTTCSSRIITTSASAIMLTFSDYSGQTPTGSFGHLQAASTTSSYDSGTYGCGLFKVFSFATQLLTVSETR